ncbi:MAG: heme-dependent oxidative N-demethylase family protein [Alkalilacustris sp.]
MTRPASPGVHGTGAPVAEAATGAAATGPAVLQSRLWFAPWAEANHRHLPGIRPLDPAHWLCVDDAFAGQMALRDRLIADMPERVHALLPEARPAAEELYARVLADLRAQDGYRIDAATARRPDGVHVPLDPARPLLTLGRLVQADLCLMEARGSEHVLTGAILCFPAGWSLAEKLGRPLTRIHDPVPEYGPDLAARVQRLFDAIHPDRPLWRANVLAHAHADLFVPRREDAPRPRPMGPAPFVRSERQCLVRLPRTRAVVFSIHTAVVRRGDLTPDQVAAFEALHPAAPA